MSQYLSRLILASSLLSASPLVLAQFIPLYDLPSVPENTAAPRTIPMPEGNIVETTSEANVRHITGLEPPAEGGSETVANFMKRLEPSVDTSLPETPGQSAIRINRLISQGYFESALSEIAKLKREDGNIATPSTDVQLLFLQARAYAGLGNRTKALEIYRQMSYQYPELAEPWNNMAVIQMQAGLPEQALESIKMALSIRPNYGIANQNIGLIYTQLANQSFNQAQRQGVSSASEPAVKTQRILNGQ